MKQIETGEYVETRHHYAVTGCTLTMEGQPVTPPKLPPPSVKRALGERISSLDPECPSFNNDDARWHAMEVALGGLNVAILWHLEEQIFTARQMVS